jgi:hypothetical protein
MKSQTAVPFSGVSQPVFRNLSVLGRTELSSFGIFLNVVSLCLLLGKMLFYNICLRRLNKDFLSLGIFLNCKFSDYKGYCKFRLRGLRVEIILEKKSAELATVFKEPAMSYIVRNSAIYGESACKVFITETVLLLFNTRLRYSTSCS